MQNNTKVFMASQQQIGLTLYMSSHSHQKIQQAIFIPVFVPNLVKIGRHIVDNTQVLQRG